MLSDQLEPLPPVTFYLNGRGQGSEFESLLAAVRAVCDAF